MLRKSMACAFALTLLWLTANTAAAQSKKALQIIPSDAAGFVIINNVGEADSKVMKLAGKMQLPIPASPLQLFQMTSGIQEGLNTKGSAVVMGFFGDQGPGVVAALPVSNYAVFAKQLAVEDLKAKVTTGRGAQGEQLVVGQIPGYALIAPPMFRAHVQHVIDARSNIADSVKKLAGWIAENDISAVATRTGIKAGAGLLLKELQKAENQVGNLPPEAQMVKSFFGPARKLINLAATEITHFAVGGRIDAKHNVHLLARVHFVKGGQISKFAGMIKTPQGGPLAGLPNGNLIGAFGGSFSSEMFGKLTEFGVNIMKSTGKIPEEKIDKLIASYRKMFQGVKGMAFAMHVSEPGSPLFGPNMISLIRTTDAPAYVKRYQQGMNEIADILKGIEAPGFGGSYTTKAVKVNGKPGVEVTVDMGGQLPPGAGGIFGEDGKMTTTIAALDDKTIVSVYARAKDVGAILTKFKKSGNLADNQQIKSISGYLPKGSQWVGYVSLRGVSELVGQLAAQFAGIQIPAFPQSPPIGFGERISEENADARVVIPIGVLENVMRYVAQLQQLGG